MHKFERKFHVLGKREKFLGWVSFRLPFEAPGRFQIQRESREKWIGMEKAHDGRALTNSFMKGLSGLLHKEQHHVFKAWVCIKQSFFYLMNLIQFVSILQKSPDWGWGRALWGHRIMKVGKDLPRSSSPTFKCILSTQGLLFPFGVLFVCTSCVGFQVDYGALFPEMCVFQSVAAVGRALASTTNTWWLWASSELSLYIESGVGGEITGDVDNPQMNPQVLIR